MPKTGPPPTPTALRRLRGNPSKRPLPKDEPQPKLATPRCPAHLGAEAKREWRRVVKIMREMGVLTVADGAAIAAYCQTWERWVQAEKAIRIGGILIRSKFTVVQNPAVTIARDAMGEMRRFLVEFGMTPAARTRVKTEPKPPEEDPLDVLRAYGERMN